MLSQDFVHRDVRAFRKPVHRLGLSSSYGLDESGVRHALDRGMTYMWWTPRSFSMTNPLKEALRANRERYVVATGPTFGWFAGPIRRRVERALRILGTDYLDVLQLYWLGRLSALTGRTMEQLVRLREEGKVRAIGVSIHDRERAGRLAADSPLDMLMIRYNAAHPGAERDIFPHLEKRHPAIVAYTATRWGKLLKRPRHWAGAVPTAGDCYRFCLSNPDVDLVLCAPKSAAQIDENLLALEKGPLTTEEMAFMREFGKVVHG